MDYYQKVLEDIEVKIGKKFYEVDKITYTEQIKYGKKILRHNVGFKIVDNSIISIGLHNCGLTSLPDTIGLLTDLNELDISNNLIIYLPESIKNLKKLKILNIAKNKIDLNNSNIKELERNGCKIIKNDEINYTDSEFYTIYQRGVYHFKNGRYDIAYNYLLNGISIRPKSFETAMLLGMACFRIKKYNESENFLLIAYNLEPDSIENAENLIYYYNMMNKPILAKKYRDRLEILKNRFPKRWKAIDEERNFKKKQAEENKIDENEKLKKINKHPDESINEKIRFTSTKEYYEEFLNILTIESNENDIENKIIELFHDLKRSGLIPDFENSKFCIEKIKKSDLVKIQLILSEFEKIL